MVEGGGVSPLHGQTCYNCSMQLPTDVDKLFVDMGHLRPSIPEHTPIVIERILKYGNLQAIKWMYNTFEFDAIRHTAAHSRELTAKDIAFWSLVLEIPKEQFLWTSRF